LTERVDAANARLEFATGAVANITASRIGMEKIRKMRFFQPHDYVAVDYETRYVTISNLAPPKGASAWPGVNIQRLEVEDVEPLRAEIEAFLKAAEGGLPSPVSGEDGRRALALALRTLNKIHEHAKNAGLAALSIQKSR
jgi:predicted dehydrogenase